MRLAFYQATMRARKRIRKKVLSMKGNAVLGFREYIEDESEQTHKIVVRCIGTAAEIISRSRDSTSNPSSPDKISLRKDIECNYISSESVPAISKQAL